MTWPRIVGSLALSACLLAGGPARLLAGQGSTLAYPDIYRARQLPELPGATIVSTGRQTSSLHDGLRLRLTAGKPLAEIRDFYRSALTSQGWKEEDSPAARAAATNPRLSVMTFGKDRVTYAVTIVAPPTTQEMQISINVLEGGFSR